MSTERGSGNELHGNMCERSHFKLYPKCKGPRESVEKLEEDVRDFNHGQKTSTPESVKQYSLEGYVSNSVVKFALDASNRWGFAREELVTKRERDEHRQEWR